MNTNVTEIRGRGRPKKVDPQRDALLAARAIRRDERNARKAHAFNDGVYHVVCSAKDAVFETDEQIEMKLSERFSLLSDLTDMAIKGSVRAMIVSGPPGLGKSFTVEEKLKKYDPDGRDHIIVKGFVGMTGLIKTLYQYRHPGNVIVFDDADSIFNDEGALNLLKCVCDTTEKRTVSYLKEINLSTDEGEMVERTFNFEGTIIFITNLDFDVLIAKGHSRSPHFLALMSRAHYIDLAMRSQKDYLIQMKRVIRQGMLKAAGLTQDQEDTVVAFIEKNKGVLREMSLRIAIKIANLVKGHDDWERVATVTCCRNQ